MLSYIDMKSVYLLTFPDSLLDSDSSTQTTLEICRVFEFPSFGMFSSPATHLPFPRAGPVVTLFPTHPFPGYPPLDTPVFQYLLCPM